MRHASSNLQAQIKTGRSSWATGPLRAEVDGTAAFSAAAAA
jgi:hypothetical protein